MSTRPAGALTPLYPCEALGVDLVEHHLVEAASGGGGGAGGLGAATAHDQQVGLVWRGGAAMRGPRCGLTAL